MRETMVNLFGKFKLFFVIHFFLNFIYAITSGWSALMVSSLFSVFSFLIIAISGERFLSYFFDNNIDDYKKLTKTYFFMVIMFLHLIFSIVTLLGITIGFFVR